MALHLRLFERFQPLEHYFLLMSIQRNLCNHMRNISVIYIDYLEPERYEIKDQSDEY